nr:lipase b [Quercus suber]
MTLFDRFVLVFFIFLPFTFASPLAAQPAPEYTFEGDAPFSINSSVLADALTCPYGKPTLTWPPVLLVHGTGTTGEESWAQGYVPALRANGYIACYVTLRESST